MGILRARPLAFRQFIREPALVTNQRIEWTTDMLTEVHMNEEESPRGGFDSSNYKGMNFKGVSSFPAANHWALFLKVSKWGWVSLFLITYGVT